MSINAPLITIPSLRSTNAPPIAIPSLRSINAPPIAIPSLGSINAPPITIPPLRSGFSNPTRLVGWFFHIRLLELSWEPLFFLLEILSSDYTLGIPYPLLYSFGNTKCPWAWVLGDSAEYASEIWTENSDLGACAGSTFTFRLDWSAVCGLQPATRVGQWWLPHLPWQTRWHQLILTILDRMCRGRAMRAEKYPALHINVTNISYKQRSSPPFLLGVPFTI